MKKTLKKQIAILSTALFVSYAPFAQEAEPVAETVIPETTVEAPAAETAAEPAAETNTKDRKAKAEKPAKAKKEKAPKAEKPAKPKAEKASRGANTVTTDEDGHVVKAQWVPEDAETGVMVLDKEDMEIAVHQADYQLEIPALKVKFPKDYDGVTAVRWASSDMNIVKVDQDGRLFPKNVGQAKITAYTKDNKYQAFCHVEITKYGPKVTTGPKISTDLWGDSYVTFGTDLDTGKSGFATDQRIKLKVDLLNLGEMWSDDEGGLPVWGEIRVYTAGDPLRYLVDEETQGTSLALNDTGDSNDGAFKIYVDKAKIHIGNAFVTLYDKEYKDLGYVNYTTGPDVAYEFISADTDRRYGQLEGRSLQTFLSSSVKESNVYGLTAGYEMNNVFNVKADVASTKKWVSGSEDTTLDSADPTNTATDWVYKLSAAFLLVPNLKIEAGYSNGIIGAETLYKPDMRFGAQASYEWNFADIFYLKPKAGFTFVQLENKGDLLPLVSGGILLGWEDKQTAFDEKFGENKMRYLKDDYGAYPGLALAIEYADKNLVNQCVVNQGRYTVVDHNMMILHGSFNTGKNLLVPNLEAVGAIDIMDVTSNYKIIGATVGAKYTIPLVKRMSLIPKAFATYYFDQANASNDYLYVKGGLKYTYQKIGFEVDYESNNLLKGFYDGEKYNKIGKLETTFSVSF